MKFQLIFISLVTVFIKASFNLRHFLGYVIYQRYGRKYLKTQMPVFEKRCGMFQVT